MERSEVGAYRTTSFNTVVSLDALAYYGYVSSCGNSIEVDPLRRVYSTTKSNRSLTHSNVGFIGLLCDEVYATPARTSKPKVPNPDLISNYSFRLEVACPPLSRTCWTRLCTGTLIDFLVNTTGPERCIYLIGHITSLLFFCSQLDLLLGISSKIVSKVNMIQYTTTSIGAYSY